MNTSGTFERVEMKFMMTHVQYEALLETMEEHMVLDEFGRHNINNIYFDTPDFLLIRRSLEKPVYKEKLRVRWYGTRDSHTPIFTELKKKYKGVVYKRRFKRGWEETVDYFQKGIPFTAGKDEQIIKELDYFMSFYETLYPALFLGYDREAFFGKINHDFRMTFDMNIRCNEENIYLQKSNGGQRIIPRENVLLEVKTGESLPRWLLDFFGEHEIYKGSFSKYGTAYQNLILPKLIGGTEHIA